MKMLCTDDELRWMAICGSATASREEKSKREGKRIVDLLALLGLRSELPITFLRRADRAGAGEIGSPEGGGKRPVSREGRGGELRG
jgi:hypothetical protein